MGEVRKRFPSRRFGAAQGIDGGVCERRPSVVAGPPLGRRRSAWIAGYCGIGEKSLRTGNETATDP
jgi:hypothetical protein